MLVGIIVISLFSVSITTISAQSQMNIPSWVKNNAIWWGQGDISDSEFLSALQFLINNGYLKVKNSSEDVKDLEEKLESYKDLKEGYQQSAIDLKAENKKLESIIENYKKENSDLRKNYDDAYGWYLDEFNQNQEWEEVWKEAEAQYAELYDEYLYCYSLNAGSSSGNYQYEQSSTPTSSKTTPSSNSMCSGTARCLIGVVTKVTDGDTISVDHQSIRFALVSSPELTEHGGSEAKDFINSICPVGSIATVDEDDGQTGGSYGRIVGVVYCNGKNLNEESLAYGHGYLSSGFCSKSEFSSHSWAQKYGC